jgi:hypothetical protein
MEWTKKKRMISCLAVGAFFVAAGACGLTDDDKKKGDPVADATGNIAVTTATEVALGMVDALVSTSGTIVKPSAGTVTALTTLGDKNCGGGGTVDYSETGGTFTANINNCTDENVTINGTAGGTVGGEIACGDDMLPTTMAGTFNGDVTVNVGSETFVFDFIDFGVSTPNISYGPDCDLDGPGAGFTATITGEIKGDTGIDIPGLSSDFDINFGPGSVVVDVLSIIDTNGIKGDGVGRQVSLTVDGTAEINSPCKKGDMTISTVEIIMTSQPSACPFDGVASYSGAFGSATVDFAVSGCDFVACEIDSIGDLF